MNISILVPESGVMEAVADPRYLFTTINKFLENEGKAPVFQVSLVGNTREIQYNEGHFIIRSDKLFSEVSQTDLIIIPALFGDLDRAIELNTSAIHWINKMHANGAQVASLCLGAFLLASTGLLDNKKCSTHWAFGNYFKEKFPKVELADGHIITEEKGIYTSGGANSYWNLLLYLVEKFTNRGLAIMAAKYFAIDIDRTSQSSFTIFQGQKEHTDPEVKNAQEFIEDNFSDKITVDQIADQFAVSRRSLERRFKKATHNTIVEYIQRVKVEAAKRSFELSRKNINEVMYDVGYTDTKAFRTIFKRITGLTPIDYRNKYNKESVVLTSE